MYYSSDQMKDILIGRCEEKTPLADPGMDGSIILKWIT
jgi:hypothetical protein